MHTDKKVHFWPGFCHVHHYLDELYIKKLQDAHPEAAFLAHPECRPEVLTLADRVLSTAGIIKEVESSGAEEFIIGTENELLKNLKRKYPEKKFYPASEKAFCYNMKKITLESILYSLQNLETEVRVSGEVREKVKKALDRMLEVGRN